MLSKNMIIYLLTVSLSGVAQNNIGIGTASPQDRLDVNGTIRSTGLRIAGQNILELGFGLTKQADNGKIGLNVFGDVNTLSIVGGGTAADGSDRRIKMWADGGSVFTGGASFSGRVGINNANPTAGKLVVHGNKNSLPLIALRDSSSFGTGSIQFANLSRPAYSINIGGDNFGNTHAQSYLYIFSPGANIASFTGDGKVGIGTLNPEERLHVNGILRSAGIRILGNNSLDLGFGLAGKEANAGRIGYGLFTPNVLDIVGGGTNSGNRKLRLWAEGGTILEGPLQTNRIIPYDSMSSNVVNFSGFTRLGQDASPPIKTKLFTGSCPGPNSLVVIPHGLNSNRIIGFTTEVVSVLNPEFGVWIRTPEGQNSACNVQYEFDLSQNNLNVYNRSDEATKCNPNIKFSVLVFYTDYDLW